MKSGMRIRAVLGDRKEIPQSETFESVARDRTKPRHACIMFAAGNVPIGSEGTVYFENEFAFVNWDNIQPINNGKFGLGQANRPLHYQYEEIIP